MVGKYISYYWFIFYYIWYGPEKNHNDTKEVIFFYIYKKIF